MTRQPASPAQMVRNKLVNRVPVRCPVCDLYVATFVGLPVIMNAKERIIEFAHPGCCVGEKECVLASHAKVGSLGSEAW